MAEFKYVDPQTGKLIASEPDWVAARASGDFAECERFFFEYGLNRLGYPLRVAESTASDAVKALRGESHGHAF